MDQPSQKPGFTLSASNYLAQAQAAAQWERDHHKALLAAGWVYDETLRHYTHPNNPNTTIEIG